MARYDTGKMRHRCDVLEPIPQSSASTARGQRTGAEKLIRVSVACSIEKLTARETELANQLEIQRAVIVCMPGDPSKPMTERQFLRIGTRRLEVAQVADLDQDGRRLELLCGETV